MEDKKVCHSGLDPESLFKIKVLNILNTMNKNLRDLLYTNGLSSSYTQIKEEIEVLKSEFHLKDEPHIKETE